MKFYKIILFVSLILSIYSSTLCSDDEATGSSAKDCEKYEKDDGFPYCCFLKGTDEGKSVETCISLTKQQYDNIKNTMKSLEENDYEIKKLDCKSFYLELSILSFILLLL
jgi:hypothetical protein